MECYLARDGAVILDSTPPPYDWVAQGGVAALCIFPDPGIPNDIWQGRLGRPSSQLTVIADNKELQIFRYGSYTLAELLNRLTFGFFYRIPVDPYVPPKASFWCPTIIRRTGYFPADRATSRYIRYCEISRHVIDAAWDERSAWVRVGFDLRRDFLYAATGQPGGTTNFQRGPGLPYDITDRSQTLSLAAEGFERLLNSNPTAPESLFHDFIKAHPVLLDIYGEVVSKPQWIYPQGEFSPSGKTRLEPDFVVRYFNQTYKLVELENPAHNIATRSDHPGVATTHAAYQIGEWKNYIDNHYVRIKNDYPGINSRCPGMVVISRDTERSFQGMPKEQYLAVIRGQLAVEEIFTYDDLVHRARDVVRGLRSLMTGYGPGPEPTPARPG
jgi:hypothetical protein